MTNLGANCSICSPYTIGDLLGGMLVLGFAYWALFVDPKRGLAVLRGCLKWIARPFATIRALYVKLRN